MPRQSDNSRRSALQVSETGERKEENMAYQKDISNLVEAKGLLERAISVLRKYYSKISDKIKAEEVALVQSAKGKRERDPLTPFAPRRPTPHRPQIWERPGGLGWEAVSTGGGGASRGCHSSRSTVKQLPCCNPS